MEKRRVGSLVMLCLLLGMLVGQSTASFQDCYTGCFILCFIQTRNIPQCSFKCIKDCITPPSTGINSQYFCELGCATYSCTNISTIGNPDVKKVADCVDGCSKPCAKN
ncbi:hypothetical protein RGQ29_025185 [Quercus rubra]|uniref:Thionin-like protein 2 n=1 Tax=Quercus rubra TaxID=3512 RepID=A0AAN7EX88_QUERU|nr:hypothetical protein RGQ29_025185 [Quercus rubra]